MRLLSSSVQCGRLSRRIPLRKTFVSLCVVLALAAAACGGGAPAMAVVNGQAITLDDLVALDPAYEQIDRFEEDALIDDLGLFVLLTAIETAARDQFGVEVTDDEIDSLFDAPTAEQAERVANWESLIGQGTITEGQARADAKSFLIREKVAPELALDSDAMRDLWDQTPQVFSTGCVRHILTQFEEEAVAAAERVNGGEDFATVAGEVSLDTTSTGGLLADPETGVCDVPLGIFVPEFGYQAAVSPVGEITGPFVSDFGWHIIVVEERSGPESLADVQADVDRFMTEEVRATLVTPWLNAAIDDAVVDVDPTIGTWSETGNAILPAENG